MQAQDSNAVAPEPRASSPRAAADAFYGIGAGHVFCQDYALAGARAHGELYALVADGCSSSRHSDWGARLLGVAAARQLEGQPLGPGGGEDQPSLEPEAALGCAWRQAQELGFAQSSLDATLLWASERGVTIEAVLCGDGVVATRGSDGAIEAWSVEFPDGAPAYPSYWLDRARLDAFLRDRPMRRVTRWSSPSLAELPAATAQSWLEPVAAQPILSEPHAHGPAAGYARRFVLPREPIELVMLLSDGAGSFSRLVAHDTSLEREPVALGAVLRELLAVPSARGEFVVRRCRRFLGAGCRQLGWTHYDDLAVAAMAWTRTA